MELGISLSLGRLGSGKIVASEGRPCLEQDILTYFNISIFPLPLPETQRDFSPIFTMMASQAPGGKTHKSIGPPFD